jgi:eukaryotic-like serine/threonine-protein kinase
MPDEPSPQLLDLLARLQLAAPRQVRAVRRRAKRLARGAPLVDLVWVDALVQSRLLTPYQGAEINAGRGDELFVGHYLLQRLTARLGYAEAFVAFDRESKSVVQLVVASRNGKPAGEERKCVADALTAGACVAQWLACQGRFSPGTALEIARQVAAALATLESSGTVHGDVSASALRIDADGGVHLTRAGVRAEVRADETIDVGSLPVEAFDYLAPDRILRRSKPSVAADIFAFGCACWHLLTGRTPYPGGNHAAKLAAVAAGKIPDLRRIAPETSAELLAVIEHCTRFNDADRPQSFAEIAKLLGPSTSAGRRLIVEAIARSQRSTVQPNWQWRVRNTARRSAMQITATAACLVLLATATWPLWRAHPAAKERPVAAQPVAVAAPTPALNPAPTQLADVSVPSQKATLQLTNYQAPAPSRPIIELPAGEEIHGASLRLQPGVTVRGQNSQRVRILAPPTGVVVVAEDVRFENIDFIWRHRSERITAPERSAIIEQRSRSAEFIGCTFQAAEAPPFGLPPAIRLQAAGSGSTGIPPACRVRLEHCHLASVAAAVDGDSAGPMAIEIHGTLHAARSPLVRLAAFPTIEAPVAIELKQTTARGIKHAIELGAGRASIAPGAVGIEAIGCVFAPDRAGTLLAFIGPYLPKPAASGRMPIEWSGEGSLADGDAVVAIWQHEGTTETLPDDAVAVEGVVTGKLEFAGSAAGDPATSRLTKWVAPLLSDEPPGIGDTLPKLPPLNLSAP